MITSLTLKVALEITREAKDSFTVTCPQIGCIFVHEESEAAAIEAAHEAIDAYVEMSLRHGDPIPPEIIVKKPKAVDRKPRLSHPATLEMTRDVALAHS